MNEWGPALAALLGVVEGLTEFLPVSSTGHLIIVGHLLGFTGAMAASVEISIQLGSILAVIVYERGKLCALLSDSWQSVATLRQSGGTPHVAPGDHPPAISQPGGLWFLIGLGVAFLPAAVVGLLAHDWIETTLFTPSTVAAALIVGGVLLLLVDSRHRQAHTVQLEQIGLRTAFLIGLAQCAALIPGISRSGATIVGGLLTGLDRRVSTEYSFFLALPTLIAATGYKLVKSHELFSIADLWALLLGLIVAFLVAWAVIAAFLTYVKRHSFQVFAYYRIVLGLVVLLLFW